MIETKDQVLEKVISQERPQCPYCNQEMSIWEVPPINFSDGLGWGTPYLFVCFNDECPVFCQGWEDLKDNYAQTASCRCMNYPGTESFELMPVFSNQGGRGQIIDDQAVRQQELLKEAIKVGFATLAECYVNKDGPAIVTILLDSNQPAKVRLKAAEMIGDIGETESIEPIRNAKFGAAVVQKQVDESIKKIHERYFTRECPYCAEIIKKRAKICKHCNRDVSGQ